MHVFITGHKGYIGSVLAEMAQKAGHNVIGCDTNFYEECCVGDLPAAVPSIKKDIRSIAVNDLNGVDAVIHLAALSNDPLGALDPRITEDINLKGTIHLAKKAKEAGVRRFLFSSSQSMHGISHSDEELDEDQGGKNPLTEYARTKWEAEKALLHLASPDFSPTFLRPSTVFGVSSYLRCDIVFNNLIASAFTTGVIEMKSDGTPWRPVLHVRDASAAFLAVLTSPQEKIHKQAFHIGYPQGNYTIRDLAEVARRAVPGSRVVYTGEHGQDARTYKISFEKLYAVLGDRFVPEWDIEKGAYELVSFFRRVGFREEDFRGRRTNRLLQIRHLQDAGRLRHNLEWV